MVEQTRGAPGGRPASPWRARRGDLVVVAVAFALVVLLLGPALGPGYVLSYDLVWVPDLALRPDFLGTGTALPRAVPSDAVVAVLDEVIPGMALQKLVLAGPLIVGGVGVARLVADLGTIARVGACVVYVWNPFVVERLVLGHWTVLIAYGLAPWIWLAARRMSTGGRPPPVLWLLVPLGSLSASAGLATAVVVATAGVSRRVGSVVWLLVVLAAGNAPWWAAGLVHAGEATSDPAGAAVFALRAEGPLLAPLAALSLGGIWNSEVVPGSRETWLAWVALVVLVAVAALGWRPWWRSFDGRGRLLACWAVGCGLAVASWAATDAFGRLAGSVPGGGVVRDGTRLLGLCVLLIACLTAYAVQWVVDTVRARTDDRAQAVFVGGLVALLPVVLLPDAAWGSTGSLRAVDYPASFSAARSVVGDGAPADGTVAGGTVAGGEAGDVLLLPFTSYRAPDWNHDHKVLDPWGRYLEPDFVASDELAARGRLLRGEDPRGDEVRAALDEATASDRSTALAGLGISVVVRQLDTVGDPPEIEGRVGYADDRVEVVELADPAAREAHSGRWWLLGPAWAAYVGSIGAGVALLLLRGRARSGRRPR